MEKHRQEVAVKEDQIKMLKGEIKNKWEIVSKQMGQIIITIDNKYKKIF